MLDNNFSFVDEQLFAELTPEEGAAISGGATYNITNDTPDTQTLYWMDSFYKPNKVKITPGTTAAIDNSESTINLLFDQNADGNILTLAGKVIQPGDWFLNQNNATKTVTLHKGAMAGATTVSVIS